MNEQAFYVGLLATHELPTAMGLVWAKQLPKASCRGEELILLVMERKV
jgi:hypothetical protein